MAGSNVRALATANSTTREVARPIDPRNPRPVRTRAAMATTTVPPAKTTADPEEPIARDSACSLGSPAVRCSRYRATTNRA